MSTNTTPQQETDETNDQLPTDPEAVTVADTGAGLLVFAEADLPTLEKRGLVDYDDDRGIVELTDSIASADVYLEVVAGQNVPWSYFYLGLSLVSGLLVALTYYEIGILENVAPIAIGGVITALFAISAVFQTLQTGRMQLGDEGPPPEIRTAESEE